MAYRRPGRPANSVCEKNAVAVNPRDAYRPRSAPPAPVVQPVSLMNQLSAMASMNAASAVSAYSGPADAPVPIPRPVRAIQVLPKTGPYQRNPMTIAATVATMIATQFIFPSSTRAGRPQPQGRAQAS